MDEMIQDVRFAWRMLCRWPTVTAVALISLVVGIALTTTVFSLLNAVLLRPLPVPDPDSLVILRSVRQDGINETFSYPDFRDYRASQRTFVDMFAFARQQVSVQHAAGSQVVAAEGVSESYFETLGVRLTLGRGLSADDDRNGASRVAVVSDTMWRDLGGESDQFTPRAIKIDNQLFSVIGVVATPFRGMEVGRNVQVWISLRSSAALDGDDPVFNQRGTSWLTVMGRLAPRNTFAGAIADLNAVEHAISGGVRRPQVGVLTLAVGRLGDSTLPQTAGSLLTLLLGAAGLVLIVACANMTNLLLARATDRAREMAVRTALGASQTRLVRLVLVETILLGALGGGSALIIAAWAPGLVVPLLGRYGAPVILDVGIDGHVVAFVAGLVLITSIGAALAPTIAVLRSSPVAVFASGSRATTGTNPARIRRTLIVAQFALSLVLVVTAVLLTRTVYNLRTLPTGLDINGVALITVRPSAAQYDPLQSQAYLNRLMVRVSEIPGVRAVGFGRVVPLGFSGVRMSIAVPGYVPAESEDMEINHNVVSPAYFDATGIALISGRGFNDADGRAARGVAVVNETMAARYWSGRNAVGAIFQLRDAAATTLEIVGVVKDVKYRMLREQPRPSFYRPLAQTTTTDGVIHVRTLSDPSALLGALHATVNDVDPAVPVVSVRTLSSQANINITDERLAMLIGLTLGMAALVLAAIGLFASMSYSVSQRTRELGVRLSLGATFENIVGLVLKQALALSLIGSLLGVGISRVIASAVEGRLFGVAVADPLTIVASMALLMLVAIAASFMPARRAAGTDPVNALRAD